MAVPPEVMKTWPKPNYVNPVSLATPVYIVNVTCIFFITLFVGGRFFTRIRIIRKPLNLDDWVMLIAYMLCFSLNIIHMVELRDGVGRHLYDVEPKRLFIIGQFKIVTQSLFTITTGLTKISICLNYLRLFPTPGNRWFSRGMIGILIGFSIVSTLVMVFQCLPVEKTWSPARPDDGRKCINFVAFYLWQGSMNAVTDLLVYLWPLYYLWTVKIPLSQRISLSIFFGLGLSVCIIAIIRLWLGVIFYRSWDTIWNGAILFMLVSGEIALGIVCGCLPSVRPLMLTIWSLLTANDAARDVEKDPGRAPENKNDNNNSGGSEESVNRARAQESKCSLDSSDIAARGFPGDEVGPFDRRPEFANTRQDIEDWICSSCEMAASR